MAELGTADRGVRTNSFYVLRATTMPALLVELAFISNPGEERLLAVAGTQERIALALADAIIDQLGIDPEPAADDEIPVTLYGADGTVDIFLTGKMIDGVTYLPARALLEALGYKIDWRPWQVDVWPVDA